MPLPKLIADCLASPAGRIMVDGAAYFVWCADEKRITVSGSIHPDNHPREYAEPPGCTTYVRTGNTWQRWLPPTRSTP